MTEKQILARIARIQKGIAADQEKDALDEAKKQTCNLCHNLREQYHELKANGVCRCLDLLQHAHPPPPLS